MFKEFMLRAMLAKQLKNLPKDQQDKMIEAIVKNPQIFKDIADSAQKKMKAGKTQMQATMEAAREHQQALKDAFK